MEFWNSDFVFGNKTENKGTDKKILNNLKNLKKFKNCIYFTNFEIPTSDLETRPKIRVLINKIYKFIKFLNFSHFEILTLDLETYRK